MGVKINKSFPTHIAGEPIITQATHDTGEIIHPDFAALWFDQKLDMGGCPAQYQRSCIGNVYMDFGHIYVELAEKIIQHIESILNSSPEMTQDL